MELFFTKARFQAVVESANVKRDPVVFLWAFRVTYGYAFVRLFEACLLKQSVSFWFLTHYY